MVGFLWVMRMGTNTRFSAGLFSLLHRVCRFQRRATRRFSNHNVF
ncbi:unnamed protein product [Brassica napus]|uniref:Uncharacterized protein n=2 Tax=Brassica TaxID=3705 RepID=A0A3P5ZE57_BRACM|nr:unnamed protein product [Brassica napus]VDC71061.1 unnamed protein product [Brassica rapa]